MTKSNHHWSLELVQLESSVSGAGSCLPLSGTAFCEVRRFRRQNVKMHQRWVEHRLEQRVELRVEQSEEQRVETRMEQKEPSVLILVFRDVYG